MKQGATSRLRKWIEALFGLSLKYLSKFIKYFTFGTPDNTYHVWLKFRIRFRMSYNNKGRDRNLNSNTKLVIKYKHNSCVTHKLGRLTIKLNSLIKYLTREMRH